MKEHYVYIHLNPLTNEIFYVGKGKGYRKSSRTARNRKWIKYVEKLEIPFKILVVKDGLSEKDALELERKIIHKIDWHYDDKTTNITDSEPDFDDGHVIQIVFSQLSTTEKEKEYIPKIRFENLTDEEIIATLLDFPNELEIQRLTTEFENVCEYFHDNWDELEETDEDIFYDLEGLVDSIEDLLAEYKCSDKKNISEFIIDLKREKIEIEIIQEDKPKGKQKKFLNSLADWINSIVENNYWQQRI